MANLLQKASIVLTPTAYDNGKVLCAKPSEAPYGDFDFSRNSAATRVNAQGLVENVQILSSNLVQNGDFSEEGVQEVSNGSFSQEGVELVTNGSFDTDSDWTKQTGWSISGGSANCDGTQTSNTNLTQTNIINDLSKTYKVEFTLSNYVSGSVKSKISNDAQGVNRTANGTYVDYLSGMTNTQLNFTANSDFIGSIDNVSVREVGQDWILETGWSIGEDKAVSDGSGSVPTTDIVQHNVFTSGKIYKVTLEIKDYVSGNLQLQNNTTNFPQSNGIHTIYSSTGGTSLILRSLSFVGSITNISVKEVGMDWVIANNVGTNTRIENNSLVIETDGAYTQVEQPSVTISGNKYKLVYTVLNSNDGNLGLVTEGNTTVLIPSSVGTHIYYFTSHSTSFILKRYSGALSVTLSNFSVIEITDDTNLPRINYENFSYQDALGSELILNGDFSTDSDWTKTGEATISGGYGNIISTTGASSELKQTILQIGVTYKYSVEVVSISSGGIQIFNGSPLQIATSIGTYTGTFVATNAQFRLIRNGVTNGSIDNVSVKEYLGQEVVPNSGCGSWLFEPQSTNIITYSEDFSQWNRQNLGVFNNNIASPCGEINAAKIVENISLSTHKLDLGGVSVGNQYTISVFAKAKERSIISFGGLGLYSNNEFVQYDLINGTAINTGTTNNASVDIEDYGNGWYRCTATYTATGSSGLVITLLDQLYSGNSDTSGGQTYQGDGTSGLYIWGAQVEQQSYATSYIPTSGSTVTRNQDLCNNGGSLATINSTEGTLYAEIAALSDDGTYRVLGLSDGTNTNRAYIGYSLVNQSIFCGFNVNSTSIYSVSHNTTDITSFKKVALKYKQNDFALWINGVEVGSQSSGITFPIGTLISSQFNSGGGNSPFFGKTKALAVWQEALSDEELAELTYPTPTDPTFTLDFDTIAEQFTFARGSEATYVDAQGLIKSTNEIGEELITNGDFSNGSTRWSLTNFSIINEKAVIDSSSPGYLIQTSVTEIGKTYRVEFTVSDYIEGRLRLRTPFINNDLESNPENGTYVYYGVADDTSFQIQSRFNGEDYKYKIDNVSVKEVISATNTPRLDYSTGAEAFLLEPQSRNLVTYSEDFISGGWSEVSLNVLANNNINPSGLLGATTLEATSVGQPSVQTFNSWQDNTNYTFSVFMKANVGNYAVLGCYGNTIGDSWMRIKLSDNSFTYDGTGFSNGKVETLTNGWIRVSVSFISSVINTGRSGFKIGLASSSSFSLGNIGDKLDIWGAQLETSNGLGTFDGSYATSYIPTNGSQTTRNQETCINATPEINSEEGVLYAEIAALSDDGTNRAISLNSGSNSNSVRIYFDSSVLSEVTMQVRSGGALQAVEKYVLSNLLDFNKIAVSYKLNNFSLWVNGSKIATDTSGITPIGLDTLSFNNGSSDKFFGNTKDVQVYTKALSDAELIKLTT